MLKGAIERGTGKSIRDLGKPLAGKTGTTNKSLDTWFLGFSPDLVVGVFVGFDQPRSLGDREQGASVAAPIFKNFMKEALSDKPGIPFRTPPDIRLVRVNASNGKPALAGETKGIILEAFKKTNFSSQIGVVIDKRREFNPKTTISPSGTGGLY